MNYNCKNCGNTFEGDDFTINCPKCHSNEIEISKAAAFGGSATRRMDISGDAPKTARIEKKLKTGGAAAGARKSQKKSKKRLVPLLALIIVLTGGGYFAITNLSGSDEGESESDEATKKEFKVAISEKEQAFFLQGSVIQGLKEEPLDLGEVRALIRKSDSLTFNFDKETGQIYFCEDNVGFTSFIVDVGDKAGEEVVTSSVKLSLYGKEPPPQAKCRLRLKSEDLLVDFADCQMLVHIKEKERFGKEDFLVSVTGESGNYVKNKFSWKTDAIGGRSADVWVKQADGLPQPYKMNGAKVVPPCKENLDVGALTAELKGFAEKFGANPRDRQASQGVQDITMNTLPGDPVFVVDGEEINGFSKVSSMFSINFMNDGTTYSLVGDPKITNEDHWVLQYAKQ